MSFSSLNGYIYIIVFYLGLLFVWSLSADVNETMAKAIVLNILIDLVLFGVLI